MRRQVATRPPTGRRPIPRFAASALIGLTLVAALLVTPQSPAHAGAPTPTDTPAATGTAAPSGTATVPTPSGTATPATPPTGPDAAVSPTPTAAGEPAAEPPTVEPATEPTEPGQPTRPGNATPPVEPRPGAEPAPTATPGTLPGTDACGGALAFGKVLSCPAISDDTRHVYTFTTTVDGERLATQFREQGENLSAQLTGPDGRHVCFLGPYPYDCVAPQAGAYTVSVVVYHRSGTGSYLLAVDSKTNPSACTELPPASFGFPAQGRQGALAAGSAGACHRFDQPAGAVLRIAVEGEGGGSLRGTVEDATGETICPVQGAQECTLRGTGPYRLFLAESYGAEVAYTLAATRVSTPDGCDEMPLARFGGPDGRTGSATVTPDRLTCQTFTASAGLHLLRFDNTQDVRWRVLDHAGAELCARWNAHEPCALPAAARYTLLSTGEQYDSTPRPFTVAVYPLATTDGCARAAGTAWDTAGPTVRLRSRIQVDCHAIDANPGDRVQVHHPGGWLTDGSGAQICAAIQDDQDGCVLPGTGPYRVITAGVWNEWSDNTYTVEVRRLDHPQGCTAVALGRYGAPPAGPATTNRCRLLTVPTAGAYRVEVVDEENQHGYGQIYDADGLRVCRAGWCTFPAAGAYTLVLNSSGSHATVFLPASGSTEGCVAGSDQPTAAPRRGEFRVAGQYDCLLLPTPTGAGLTLLRPQDARGAGYPEMTVHDAAGRQECDIHALRDYSCILQGTAPFRVILHLDEDTPDVTGGYLLGFARTGGASGCPVLPRGSFTAASPTALTLGGDRYAGCFSIPADQHSTAEVFSFQRTAGTGQARVSVFVADGRRFCHTVTSDAEFALCHLEPGPATVIVEGTTAAGTYALSRRDVTGSAAGCRTVTSTRVGGPAIAGTVTSGADVHCFQVTADATDRLAIDTRDTARMSRAIVLEHSGADARCVGYVHGCSVSGAPRYQVLVFSNAATGSTPYQLDVWKVWANGKPPAECAPIPSNAYGFGPYTGTLTNADSALCLATTTTWYDDFTVAVANPQDASDDALHDYGLYAITPAGMESCAIGDGGFHCWRSRERSQPTVYLLTNGDRVTPRPYRLEATCHRPLCGGNTFTATAVRPAAVPQGATRIITVHGTSLHERDTVQVTPAGHAPLTATVQTVAADRTSLTAAVDLTAAPAGPASVTVRSYGAGGDPVVLAGALTVTPPPPPAAAPPPLRVTRAPAVTGTVAVGATVRAVVGGWTPAATAYAYQWRANGAVIGGATGAAYRIVPAALGKRLSVTVTAQRPGHRSAAATSAPSVAVARGPAPRASRKPTIRGAVRVGRTVQVSFGSWSPWADAYRFEWRVNGAVVRGATRPALRLTPSMRNKRLTVTVVARKRGHADGRTTSGAVVVRR